MNIRRLLPAVTAVVILGTCVLAYWPGLYGTFIFDDIPNLGGVQQWIVGAIGWQMVVFDNLAGPLGRPISMATFLADGAIWGMNPFGFKIDNLLLHLATGIAVFFLVKEIAKRSCEVNSHPALLAVVISAIWLLHPIQTGTVLYVIQRMAMLSTLFIVLTMLAYIIGRVHLEAGQSKRGIIWMFIAVPLLTLLAAFSKENGLLAPLLCGVIEWIWFRPESGARRSRAVRLFLIWIVIAPIFSGLMLLLIQPELLLSDYGNRRFNLVERLLTQSRVLFDYIGKLLWPNKFSMFRDDYIISTGLFTPPTTALALAGWIVVITAAVRLRRKLPLFSGGVAIYLAGHALESSVFPLMVYFEHRNYFPSIGIFLAVAGLLIPAWQRLESKMDHPDIIATVGISGLFLVLAFATHGRALVWETKELLVVQSLQNYPNSRFIRSEMANLEMNRSIRNPSGAREHMQVLQQSDRPLVQMVGELALLKIDCISGIEIGRQDLENTFQIIPHTLEADLVMSLRGLIELSKSSPCTGLDPESLADYLAAWLDHVRQPEELQLKGRLRLETGWLYYEIGRYKDALAQAQLARISSISPVQSGLLLASLYVKLGDINRAKMELDEFEEKLDPGNENDMGRFKRLRNAVQSSPSPDPGTVQNNG